MLHSNEFERIARLPRRTWSEDDAAIWQLTFEMSKWLRLPGSTATLRPVQAVALCELYYYRRLFGCLGVGEGKTLVSFLAPTVLGAQRPMLILPAKLRDVKTPREFAKLAKDWRSPASLRIISYEELQRDYGHERVLVYNQFGQVLPGTCAPALFDAFERNPGTAIAAHFDGTMWVAPAPPLKPAHARVYLQVQAFGLLDLADPDLIMLDECHRAKSKKSARARKIARFMARKPETVHVDMSGSITKDSIRDYSHILEWTHKEASPLPLSTHYNTLKDWANALDVKVSDEDRVQVGALLELASDEERKTLDPTTAARRGFRRRLTETPGVIASGRQYEGASLLIQEIAEPDYDSITEDNFLQLRLKGELPDGTTTSGGLDDWRHERTMCRGYFTTWDPAPPTPWKLARTEWNAAVRYAIANNQKGLDSEFQIAGACAIPYTGQRGAKYTGQMWDETRTAYHAWIAIKDTFTPNMVERWFDDAALEFVATWMADHRGLVWIENVAFGKRLAQMTGALYFQEKGIDARTRKNIEDARPATDGSIIVSIESNKEGRNLQEHWSENFFGNLPKGGDNCEQTIGRTHRPGQVADEVSVDVAVWCKADGNAWLNILSTSTYSAETTLPAKVFYADVVMPDADELAARAKRTARFA